MLKALICLAAGVTIALSSYSYTPKQLDLMRVVEQQGQQSGTSEWLKGILLRESKAGTSKLVGAEHLPINQRSYGVMQLQLSAARSVMRSYPELSTQWFGTKRVSDTELATFLTYNHEANIKIAAKHLDIYIRLCGGNIPKAVVAYNVGIGNVRSIRHIESHPYLIGVRQNMKSLPDLDA